MKGALDLCGNPDSSAAHGDDANRRRLVQIRPVPGSRGCGLRATMDRSLDAARARAAATGARGDGIGQWSAVDKLLRGPDAPVTSLARTLGVAASIDRYLEQRQKTALASRRRAHDDGATRGVRVAPS